MRAYMRVRWIACACEKEEELSRDLSLYEYWSREMRDLVETRFTAKSFISFSTLKTVKSLSGNSSRW